MSRHEVSFRCHHTGHCCTEVVCMPTPWDVIRIVRDTGESPYDFLEFLTPDEVSGVDDDDPTWLEVDGEYYIMALQRHEKRGCFFLNRPGKECGIYESRPILCRLYPFKLQEKKNGDFKGFTLHKDVGCPKFQDGTVDADALYELYLDDSGHQDDYVDLVNVFNKREYKGKRPEDFVEMFVVGAKKS